MKSYKEFLMESEIDSICSEYNITNYTINDDKTIDVNGDVYLCDRKLTKLPLKFRKVSGYFSCSYNNLISLEGCPSSIDGNFHCGHNQLTTLEGCPKSVNGSFTCFENMLTTLEGCPTMVGDEFDCSNNELKSLVGCPERIGAYFYCDDNKITDFNGISDFFDGGFDCGGNSIYEIWSLFNDVRCIRLLNEFDVIQGNKIILDRLEEVYHQLGMEIPENIQFENYEII